MQTIIAALVVFLVLQTIDAKSPLKKGKDDLYSYSSVTAVFFPEEAGSNALCRTLDCQEGNLCVVFHGDRAVCMTEKSWKKMMKTKKADTQKKQLERTVTKSVPSFQNDCQPCPVVHPVFVCGSDNVTYSSECRLQFKNCEDNTSVKVACQGRCPCPVPKETEVVSRVDSETSSNKGKPQGATRKAMLKKSMSAVTGVDAENHVVTEEDTSKKANKVCAKKEMRELKRRLVSWFWAIFRQKHPQGDPMDLTDAPVCRRGASQGVLSWMFAYFDDNKDGSLTLTELFDLESDKYEHCVNPFLEHCDADDDLEISGHEWCKCLQKH
ncbi:hypothetical protein BV898_12043 [Hypsibius exemplaris]|uniref:Kazal-like domain-containing protein n=1 Tax=Hypsibius exemplaris TaxID=2072580 RepID=A0A1W0WEW4_HYPEX|nr:hypothetical protein BV898_12043 [Hypsibius exemplaris]